MGEIAEMMLDGTLCAGCGVALLHGPDEEPAGYPQYCEHCSGEEIDFAELAREPTKCPDCGKVCKGHQGYLDHWRAKHDTGGNEQ